MVLRRFIVLLAACGLLLAGMAEPALAKAPRAMPADETLLTPEQQAASDRKVAAALLYLAGEGATDGGLANLACVPTASPLGEADARPANASLADVAAVDVHQSAITVGVPQAGAQPIARPNGCWVPQGFVPVEARDQVFGHYCGPAVGQVISNYSWAVRAGANKYTQQKIAGWMSTDANGQTTVGSLEWGLENATWGSPRRPKNWDWVITRLEDSDRDGTAGDQLQDLVRANVSGSKMPLAISVKPHDARSKFRLASWPRPVNSVGHYVAIYGWVHHWNGGDAARVYYTDSSRDEGGSTGKFWDPTRHIAILILEHTRMIVW